MILPSQKLNWLYFDLDCYFASVEQQDKPELAGIPVAVVPMNHNSATIIAASREAKKFGIGTGTKVFEAKKQCTNIKFVTSNHVLYSHYHHKIFDEIKKYICIDHIYSIDEGACKLTGIQQDEEEIAKLTFLIKQGIRQNIGQYITCSIGIGPNRFLAKIASNIQKPNGITIIRPHEIQTVLQKLGLRDLPGIGKATYNRLLKNNINSIEDLFKVSSDHLHRIWGSINGKRMWYLLRGADLPAEEKKRTTLSQSKVLIPQEYNINSARSICQQLILKSAKRLRAKHLYTSKITLKINALNNITLKEKRNILAANDSQTIKKYIMIIWDELIQKNNVTMVKKVSLELCGLAKKSQQLSLFSTIGKNKNEEISKIIDGINREYGANTISIGLINKKDDQDIIAFRSIPDDSSLS